MNVQQVPKPVLDAAVRLIETLAGDPSFVDAVAEDEIKRRVAAGLLVPIERLQVAAGLSLTPAGRLEQLEAATRVVVDRWMNVGADSGWTDEERALMVAIRQLSGVLGYEEDEQPIADDEDETPEVDVEDDDVPSGGIPDEVEDEQPTPQSRSALPEIGDTGPCERCDEPIVEPEQARLSYIRTREVLCRSCHQKWNPGGDAPDDDAPEVDTDEPPTTAQEP